MELLQGPPVNISCQGLARFTSGPKGPARISSWTGSLSGTSQPSSPLILPGPGGTKSLSTRRSVLSHSPLWPDPPRGAVLGFSSMSPTSWEWALGMGRRTQRSRVPRMPIRGPETIVTLTVTNAYGTCTLRKTDYISVTPPPPFLELVVSETPYPRGINLRHPERLPGPVQSLQHHRHRFR